jgi:uncharacterized BrkB/YihY/UPF0761 family membrane protein
MPQQSESVIRDIVKRLVRGALGLCLWDLLLPYGSLRQHSKGIILSLDTAYAVKNSRSPWLNRVLALGLTVFIGVLFLLAVFVMTLGLATEVFLRDRFRFSTFG